MNEQQNPNEHEQQEPIVAVERVTEAAPDPFAKGRERMASIGTFFTKAKEKVSAFGSSVGGAVSRFWSRTKKVGNEIIPAILSADDLAKKADKAFGQGVENAGVAIGKAGAQATHWAGEKLVSAYDTVDSTLDAAELFAEKAGHWAQRSAAEVYDRASRFTSEKVSQVKTLVSNGIEMTRAAGMNAALSTREGMLDFRDKAVHHYDAIKTYGENAIITAEVKTAKAKKGFWDKVFSFVSSKAEKANAMVAEKIQKKNGLLTAIETMQEVAA